MGLATHAHGAPLTSVGCASHRRFASGILAVQVANLFGSGADKQELGKRVQFVQDRYEYVFDSATNPLDGEHK